MSSSSAFAMKTAIVALYHGLQLGSYVCVFRSDIAVLGMAYVWGRVCLPSLFTLRDYSLFLGGGGRHHMKVETPS